MSEAELQLRFDGPELQAHEMDVTLLGPALLAFGEMCSEANTVLNGAGTKARVFLKADVKANCVTIDFHLVQTLFQQASDLVANRHVVSAKEILEWIGIIGGGGGVMWAGVKGTLSLIEFLKWKKGKRETSTEIIENKNGNVVKVQINGTNNHVLIAPQVYQLSQNSKVVESVKALASPISLETGIHEAVFIHDKKEQLKIDAAIADELREAHTTLDDLQPQTFTAHIVTHGAVFDSKSKFWKFKLNDKVHTIDILAKPI